jgi:hypothetical protein
LIFLTSLKKHLKFDLNEELFRVKSQKVHHFFFSLHLNSLS